MKEVHMSLEFDIVIKSGRIVDGTGNPWHLADIGIKQGRITRIQKEIEPQSARRVIDSHGLIVCPGFIDIHSHDDVDLLLSPQCDEKILQEIKTRVACAMEEGAFGLSTGLIDAPGNYARTEEILELAKTAGRHHGIYTTHMRSEGDAELAAIGEVVQSFVI
jgi:N-acyl-D-aspartate/D-glutamate deacylase